MKLYTPSVFHGQIPYRFQTLNRHKIDKTNAGNMKTCGKTKVGVLHLNLASKTSYEGILDNFQNEAVDRSVVFGEVSLLRIEMLAILQITLERATLSYIFKRDVSSFRISASIIVVHIRNSSELYKRCV